MARLELPLLRHVLRLSGGNQLKAARAAGHQSQYAPQAAARARAPARGAERERIGARLARRRVWPACAGRRYTPSTRAPAPRLVRRRSRPRRAASLPALGCAGWAASPCPASPPIMSRAGSAMSIRTSARADGWTRFKFIVRRAGKALVSPRPSTPPGRAAEGLAAGRVLRAGRRSHRHLDRSRHAPAPAGRAHAS